MEGKRRKKKEEKEKKEKGSCLVFIKTDMKLDTNLAPMAKSMPFMLKTDVEWQ